MSKIIDKIKHEASRSVDKYAENTGDNLPINVVWRICFLGGFSLAAFEVAINAPADPTSVLIPLGMIWTGFIGDAVTYRDNYYDNETGENTTPDSLISDDTPVNIE